MNECRKVNMSLLKIYACNNHKKKAIVTGSDLNARTVEDEWYNDKSITIINLTDETKTKERKEMSNNVEEFIYINTGATRALVDYIVINEEAKKYISKITVLDRMEFDHYHNYV